MVVFQLTGRGRCHATALRGAGLALLLVACLATPGTVRSANAEAADPSGYSAAVVTEIEAPPGARGQDLGNTPRRGTAPDADDPPRPYWCNKTGTLVDDIHKLGGESVMRLELDGGRTLERYMNASEEVIIEHGADGNSCLVEMRARR